MTVNKADFNASLSLAPGKKRGVSRSGDKSTDLNVQTRYTEHECTHSRGNV